MKTRIKLTKLIGASLLCACFSLGTISCGDDDYPAIELIYADNHTQAVGNTLTIAPFTDTQALYIIGGDGSFKGAQKLSDFGVNTIGLPGTIDLDIACTEYTIGFDTAVNTAMEAIDKVRDTSTSHERCSVIEVMGRDAGYLALWCGIANGAEKILLPEEHDYDEAKIIADIKESRKRGKKHYIIINAEGIGDSMNMAKRIEKETGMETRATILGHMQRGGSPTAKDRVYASIMGSLAVDLLLEGKTNRVVGYKHGEYIDFDINEALAMQKGIPEYQYDIAKQLAI